MPKKNIAVLFGGNSSEHEISRKSAVNILSNIPKDKYNVFIIGITKQGKWILYPGSIDNILDGSWENCSDNKLVFAVPDPNLRGVLVVSEIGYEILKIDVVIPVFHGKNGEDGTVQGLFTLSKIPFVGSDILSSAMCMDKVVSNIMFENKGLEQAKFVWFYSDEYLENKEYYCNLIEDKIKEYPIFIKPANAGSSVGISKVYNRSEITDAVLKASCEDKKILVEQGIKGQELECAVMGNEKPVVSIIGEIKSCNNFYDYDAKYINSGSELIIPANISNDISEKIREIAIKAYKIMGCNGLARVDFFLEESTNRIFINEINTFPGFTDISMYPILMVKSGYNLPKLIDNLISLAIDKNNNL